jgi:hypothetical protein
MIRIMKRTKELHDKPTPLERRTREKLRRAEILELKREADRHVIHQPVAA